MAKKGMKRPEIDKPTKNEPHVPEIQGNKHDKKKIIKPNPPPKDKK